MTYPAIIFWCLAIWALVSRGPVIYYLFFAGWSFDMLSVVPTQDIGVTLTPGWISASLLIGKTLVEAPLSRTLKVFMHPVGFLPLVASAVYGVSSAFLMPRLFEGRINIFPVRASNAYKGAQAIHPAMSNIAQSIYYVLIILLVLAVYFICSDEKKMRHFFRAFIFGAIVAIATGILDAVVGAAHLSAVLKPFRNANYALIEGAEILGVRRIIGLMPEASSYAGLAYSFLVIIALVPIPSRYFPSMRPNRLLLSSALILMTLGSTSSSGIVGIIGLTAIVGCWAVLGAMRGRLSAITTLFIGVVLATIILGLILFQPTIAGSVSRMFDALILKKNQTDSYLERSSWNNASFDAFQSSFGLGLGIGSARASSFIPAVLSNLGGPGVACLIAFYAQMLMRRAPVREDRELAGRLKLAVPAGLITIIISGTSANFGLANAVLYGSLIALVLPEAGRLRGWRPQSPAPGDGSLPASSTLS